MSEQIAITVINEQEKQPLRLLHESGRTILQTMRGSGMVLPALCDGMGKCGRCRVRFHGCAPLPTPTERALLEPELLRQGYRLACMARPTKDCVVECAWIQAASVDVVTRSWLPEREERRNTEGESGVEEACGQSMRRKPGAEEECEQKQEKVTGVAQDCGQTFIAADIGTTTIAMQLIEAANGRVLATYTCMNPQRSYGTDVISRIQAAAQGAGNTLQRLVEEALREGVHCFKDAVTKYREKGVCVEAPRRLCIACNTMMGHIFLGYDTSGLGKTPFEPVSLETTQIEWEGMQTVVLPGISAFVGGDIVAGLYACGLCENKFHLAQPETAAWLFLDLGTNAEMVMGVGKRMVCTAAAAGPAFEGKGVDGATGTDRIRAIALLLEQGLVDETGLLQEPYFSEGVKVELPDCGEEAEREVFITQEDIRQLQMAKAAVRAGIHFLMKKLGIREFGQLEKIYIAGGFGFYLDMDAAAGIGLLPAVNGRAKAVGNTSLAGAALFGRESDAVGDSLESAIRGAEVFNLAEEELFEQVYVEYMNFTKE